jgi:acetylornithine deacetylase
MDALQYAKDLVAFDSTSVLSNVAVSDHVEDALQKLAFATERVEYEDARGVRKCNVIGKKGEGLGGLAYFSHTDVVPVTDWFSDEHGPFHPTVKDERLYGRGSCDMKGSLACMLEAASRFSASELQRPLYVVATADEEVGNGGAAQVAKHSELFREMVDGHAHGIIGEPTRLEVVYAHKGACGFKATARGRAAHSSTREGLNANLAMIPFLVEMKALHDLTETDPAWHNDEFDPPTVSWNIGVNDHTYAVNITPPQSVCTVYFRPMPGQDPEYLMNRVRAAAEKNGLELRETLKGPPLYVNPDGEYVREVCQLAGVEKPRTVAYGTDACMLLALKHLVVFGPGDIAQAHTRDEWISLEQLRRGTDLYSRAVRRWCC